MSLRSDWEFYLSGTYVSTVHEGLTCPFHVAHVTGGDSFESLVFHGTIITPTSSCNRELGWEDIIVKYPRPGYVKCGGKVIYLTLRPRRNRLKGLYGDKIKQHYRLSADGVRAIWFPDFEGRLSTDLYYDGSNIFYKGVQVGSYSEALILIPEAEHLRGELEVALKC